MSALVLTATERRVYRALVELANRLDLQVTHRQVAAMARVAARAAKQSRPKDTEGSGRKPARKAAVRPPKRRTPARESSASSEGATEAPGAVSAIRGAA